MKTQINMKRSIKALLRLCFLLLPVFFISSCIKPTIFTVQFPQSGATYVGNEIVDFVIKYSKSVPRADIYLNGTSISDEFVYGPTSATASITDLKKYLKQGVNSLTVDPLAFGPSVKFVVDNAGPVIIITKGLTSGGSTAVDIEGELRDVSGISSFTLNLVRVTATDPTTGAITRATGPAIPIVPDAAGKFKKTGIDISAGVTIYTFTATDIHGQITTKEYLADSNESNVMAISNAVRVAVGDSFVESLRPIIAAALYSSLQEAPIDIRWQCWNDPNKTGDASQNPNGGFCAAGQDGATFNSGLNPIYATLLGIPMTINIKQIGMQPNKSTVLLNKFKVQANNYLKIDMVITDMLVSLSIALKILFINLNIDPMTMTIGRIVVDTGANSSVVNKKMHVELQDSNFDLQNITVSQTSIGGIDLGGLVDIIMPLIEGIIGGLLPGILNPILNTELQKIVIGACMYPIDQPPPGGVACNAPTSTAKFNWAVNLETLKTDNLFGAGAPYDMILSLETMFNLLDADTFARPALGPRFVEDPVDVGLIYNSLGETGTNLTVAVSSNAMNQAFSALYASGYSHMSFVNGKISYGANPSLPVGTDGQTRIRLYPESPPYFTLNPVDGGIGGAAAARIGYESAILHFDLNEAGVWKEQLRLAVDFSIAASIAQVGNAVRLGIDGSPVFNLNTMVNNTGLPVTQGMLQSMLDMVTMYFLPSLTDEFIIIDLARIADTTLNGTQVLYQTDTDTKTQTLTAGGCPIATSTNGADSKLDYVCETINFVVNTNTLTSTGIKGTNLLFQMEARDPDIPAASAIPRFDLDSDGVLDYKDNCAAPILMQVAAINLEGGLTAANVDINGNPVGNFEARIKSHINRWVAAEHGITMNDAQKGRYNSTPYVAGTYTPIPIPSAADIAWWNVMRKGDTAITSLPLTNPDNSVTSNNWLTMIYANANQRNIDGDRSGDLCEDDADRDGIYSSNGEPIDSCPRVYDPTNDSGACTIDQAEFVMFKNKARGKCLSHLSFAGAGDSGGVVDFYPGNSTAGSQLRFQDCDVNNLGQRFYVEVSASDSDSAQKALLTSCGTGCVPRIIHIYTNQDKQTGPGFYDIVNMHYLASTISGVPGNSNACTSSYWAKDAVITTTMCGYDSTWRDWVLTLSYTPQDNVAPPDYPFMIESFRALSAYPGQRGCILDDTAVAGDEAGLDITLAGGTCYPGAANDTLRIKSSFNVLLGEQQAVWSGLFSDN